MSSPVPEYVERLFWEVNPAQVDLELHRDYVIERVMARGGWDAMRWLRGAFPCPVLADFLKRKGSRLAPRNLAYWALVCEVATEPKRGGGRPPWVRHD